MANRVPLVIDASTLYLKELPANDNLDLTGSGIHNAGVITATSFSGDGSGLTGVAAGYLEKTSVGVNTVTNVGVGTTNPTSTLTVGGNANVTGVVTATTFIGALTGDVTGDVTGNLVSATATAKNLNPVSDSAHDLGTNTLRWQNVYADAANITAITGALTGNATGLSGTPSITVQDVTAQMVSVAGTMQYEDVVNVDSAGIGTFKGGLDVVGSAVTIHSKGVHVTGVVTATSFVGSGANLTDVISGTELKQAGTSVGTAVTQINFASGATLTTASLGISTVTIAAGIETNAYTVTNGNTATLNLDSYQDHKVTATGTVTITTTGGSEGGSHGVRIINNGTATVGFSTNFLWPSGSTPSLPTADKAVSFISFTVNKVGVGTQLLSGASLNYS